jgi:hypothetical protein
MYNLSDEGVLVEASETDGLLSRNLFCDISGSHGGEYED